MKFGPPYACIFMDHIETEFFVKPWLWKRFIEDFLYMDRK